MYRLILLRSLALTLLIAAPAAAQTIPPECQPVVAAGEKQFTLPSHAYILSKGLTPAPMQSETININGVSYVMVHDRWMRSPVSSAQLAQQAKDKIKTAKAYTCKQLADEPVGTTPASVYTSHTDTGTGTTDVQLWVGKTSGLPLKSEIDLNSNGHKSHVSVRYEYENVKVPAGVQ